MLVGFEAGPGAGKHSMNHIPNEIVDSHLACRRMTCHAGSNFPAAFRLLPPAKRQAMYALYAFTRHSDDLADEPPRGHSACEVLRRWRTAFTGALAGQVLPGDRAWAEVDDRGRAILPAVVQTVRDFQIPPDSLLAVLDGVEMDLRPRTYTTFDELAVYCERVASAVGMACIHIWGFSDDSALASGRSAGLALQLTNILRDLSEDCRRGRVYLPEEDLRACGYSAEELQGGVVNRPFLRLMEMEIQRAEQFYRWAAELPRWLHQDGHRIFGLMMDTYHALLRAIRHRPAEVFARRVRVSRLRKLWLASRWTLLPVPAWR
jgi:15-cis-phytoene synthase